jgi:adenylate cyclase
MRKVAAGVGIGLGAAAITVLLGFAGAFDVLEWKTYDWRMRTVADWRVRGGRPAVDPGIVLVEINDAAINDLASEVGRWPWPRAIFSLLVDYLHRGNPRVIALDIGFWEPERQATYQLLGQEMTSTQSDALLAEAVARAGNVVLLADAVNPGKTGSAATTTEWDAPPYRLGEAGFDRPVVTLPYEGLKDAAAAFGHNFQVIDPDGPARRVVPFIRHGDRFMPWFGLAVALKAAAIAPADVTAAGGAITLGGRRLPLVGVEVSEAEDPSRIRVQQTALINYLAPVHVDGRRPYQTYAANDLLRSEGQLQSGVRPDVDPAVFRDKIVFVGLTASGLLDVFQTPLGAGVMPGIQLHANVLDSVLSGRPLALAPRWSGLTAIVTGGLLAALMTVLLRFSIAAAGTTALALAWTTASLYAFERGLSLSLAQPLIALALALFAGTTYRYFVEDAEKRKVSRLFGRYVSKDVYAQLMSNPSLAELGGSRRDMTVLFSDIRGFTSVTEKGDPETLVAQLNEYFTSMVEIVFRHEGTVDKFVGDMVMALFGAPVDDEEHPDHAVAAALDMVGRLGELNRKWAGEGRPRLDIGIGINSGDMIAGNIGSSAIMSYTVIGDNVNLASRLESLNKDYGTRIIISDATRQRLRRGADIRPLGQVVVKGKTQPVVIFEVTVASPLDAPPAAPEAQTVKEAAS